MLKTSETATKDLSQLRESWIVRVNALGLFHVLEGLPKHLNEVGDVGLNHQWFGFQNWSIVLLQRAHSGSVILHTEKSALRC